MRQNQTKEQAEWAALSNRDKALTWTKANKFSVVAGRYVEIILWHSDYV